MSLTQNEFDEEEMRMLLELISNLKRIQESAMKMRLKIAQMQMQVLSLYGHPSLELLQNLENLTESSQVNYSTENNVESMQDS